MSQSTWGKIKFKEKTKQLNNFKQENIWIMFDLPDDEKWPLHISKLEKNEIYFDILCDFYKYTNVNPYDYSNNDDFFMIDSYDRKGREDFYERLKKVQRVLETLLKQPDVIEVSFFNTWQGTLCCVEDYDEVNWKLEDFASEFFKLTEKEG